MQSSPENIGVRPKESFDQIVFQIWISKFRSLESGRGWLFSTPKQLPQRRNPHMKYWSFTLIVSGNVSFKRKEGKCNGRKYFLHEKAILICNNLVALQGVHCSPSKNLELGIMYALTQTQLDCYGRSVALYWMARGLLQWRMPVEVQVGTLTLPWTWADWTLVGWYLTWKHWRDLTSCQNSLRRGLPPPCPPKGGWGRLLRSHHWSNWMALGHWSWLDESESWNVI